MNFSELVSEVKKIKLQEIRSNTGTYFEAVVLKENLPSLESALAAYFGTPAKPAGVFAEGEINRYARPYGGVRHEQTMYLKKLDHDIEFAFLWPWGCGTLVTLKVFSDTAAAVRKQSAWYSGLLKFLFGK